MAEPDPYAQLYAHFRWHLPGEFNIAEACCARWAHETPDAPAVLFEGATGCRAQYSFGQLQRAAGRLANALKRRGVQRGERVALLLPQRFETVVAHIAIQMIGAVALPIPLAAGASVQAAQLRAGAAALAIASAAALPGLQALRAPWRPARGWLVVSEGQSDKAEECWLRALQSEDARFEPEPMCAEDAAVLLSQQRGHQLLPQRALIGHLSGFVASQNWFGFDPVQPAQASRAVFWTAADWASSAGLMGGLLPALYFGRPVVAWQERFDAVQALSLVQRHGISHALLPTSVLSSIAAALPLQALASAGDTRRADLIEACRDSLGLTVNTPFEQGDIGAVVGHCTRLWDARPGSLGRAYPGHRVAVIDAHGHPCPFGVVGELALHRCDLHGSPDPIFSVGVGVATDGAADWWRSGARALQDEAGFFWPGDTALRRPAIGGRSVSAH